MFQDSWFPGWSSDPRPPECEAWVPTTGPEVLSVLLSANHWAWSSECIIECQPLGLKFWVYYWVPTTGPWNSVCIIECQPLGPEILCVLLSANHWVLKFCVYYWVPSTGPRNSVCIIECQPLGPVLRCLRGGGEILKITTWQLCETFCLLAIPD
jgi:hypothetical protein